MQKFEIDDEYLGNEAWDMLSKNCFYKEGEYHFFDFEAKANFNIRKSEYIVYELDWIRSIGICFNDFTKVYIELCGELDIKPINYQMEIFRRSECILSILTTKIYANEYYYRKYLDIPLHEEKTYGYDIEDAYIKMRDSVVLDNALFIESKVSIPWFKKQGINTVTLYGMGKYGKKMYKILENTQIKVNACVDTMNCLENIFCVDDIKLAPPSDLIIITMRDYEEVYRELSAKGYRNVLPIRMLIDLMEE